MSQADQAAVWTQGQLLYMTIHCRASPNPRSSWLRVFCWSQSEEPLYTFMHIVPIWEHAEDAWLDGSSLQDLSLWCLPNLHPSLGKSCYASTFWKGWKLLRSFFWPTQLGFYHRLRHDQCFRLHPAHRFLSAASCSALGLSRCRPTSDHHDCWMLPRSLLTPVRASHPLSSQ